MAERHDTLSQFGTSFQNKVVSCLISDGKFLSKVNEILFVDYFESQANKWIVDETKKYFIKFGTVPSLDVFKVNISEVQSEVLAQSVKDSLRSAWEFRGASDLDFIKDKFTDFCRNQKMKSAIMKSVDLMESGDFESIRSVVDNALRAGLMDDIGYDYKANVDSRLDDEEKRDTIPTPWPVINELMDGGLGAGEIACVLAPTGGGKSWILGAIASHAASENKIVFHYSMENGQKLVAERYDSIFTGIVSTKHSDNKDKIKSIIKRIAGNLIIKIYPTKTASVRTLISHIEQAKATGVFPDLIIVDYADLLRPSGKGSDSKYEELGTIYEELRGMAGTLEVPVWTASQVNRDGTDDEIIRVSAIADSYAKAMVCDFIMSASRKDKDKINNTARVHIVKNRLGPDGMTLHSNMDLSNGDIEIHSPNSSDAIITEKRSKSGPDIERQGLAKKYNELM